MSNLKSFVRLEFKTIQPYFTLQNSLLFAAVAVFLSVMSGSVYMSIGIGIMLGTLFISYPFAVGDKSNLDALYVTLSVKRGTVVLGRYLFILALNLLAVLGSFVCASFGLFATRLLGVFQTEAGGNTSLPLILTMAALMILVQIIQMPLFFKLGYNKARFLSILPFAFFMAGFAAFINVTRDTPNQLNELWGFFTNVTKNGMAIPLAVLVLAFAAYVSYRLSLSSYRKREF